MKFIVTMERDETGMIVVECPSITGSIMAWAVQPIIIMSTGSPIREY